MEMQLLMSSAPSLNPQIVSSALLLIVHSKTIDTYRGHENIFANQEMHQKE